jgi:hypothetical protein
MNEIHPYYYRYLADQALRENACEGLGKEVQKGPVLTHPLLTYHVKAPDTNEALRQTVT